MVPRLHIGRAVQPYRKEFQKHMLRGIATGFILVVALFAAPTIANAQNEIFMYGSSPDFQFTGTGTDVN